MFILVDIDLDIIVLKSVNIKCRVYNINCNSYI